MQKQTNQLSLLLCICYNCDRYNQILLYIFSELDTHFSLICHRRSWETQIIKVHKLDPAKLGCFEK